MARVTQRMLARLAGVATIDLDATDVEVYGRKKRGVAYNHQGQRCGPPPTARPSTPVGSGTATPPPPE